jgi:hypothetical protein
LLKFLDVHEMLSVQVHPTKANTNLLPAGETPKTEAWVVLEAGTQSRIYAGLKPDTTEADLRRALTNGTLVDHLACLTPKPGDAVFLRAGTVHSLGGDLVVFEIQQNSDVTFRLYDWDHIDAKTGKPRALQVDEAMACIDFAEGPVGRVTPLDTGNAIPGPTLRPCFTCGGTPAARQDAEYFVLRPRPCSQADASPCSACHDRASVNNRTARKNVRPRNRMIRPASRISSDARWENISAPKTPRTSTSMLSTTSGRPVHDGAEAMTFSFLRSCQRTNKAKRRTNIPCEKFGSLFHCRKR